MFVEKSKREHGNFDILEVKEELHLHDSIDVKPEICPRCNGILTSVHVNTKPSEKTTSYQCRGCRLRLPENPSEPLQKLTEEVLNIQTTIENVERYIIKLKHSMPSNVVPYSFDIAAIAFPQPLTTKPCIKPPAKPLKKPKSSKTRQKHQCPLCPQQVGNLKRHHEMVHVDSARVCDVCGVMQKNVTSLQRHLKWFHGTARYPCEDCGKEFKETSALKLHRSYSHAAPSKMCETCGRKFFTKYSLVNHVNTTHRKLRPHVCDVCNKALSTKYALSTHRRTHTNETPYKCHECGMGFKVNISRKLHMRSKHNIEEPKTCKCNVCGKGMATDAALRRHFRIHE